MPHGFQFRCNVTLIVSKCGDVLFSDCFDLDGDAVERNKFGYGWLPSVDPWASNLFPPKSAFRKWTDNSGAK